MIKRVLAAVGAGATVLVMSAVSVGAQTYPPAPNAITVDDPTPIPGQVVTVTLRTCRPDTYALIGIGLSLVGTPRVDAQGVAVATVTVPASIRPGRHVVSGTCLGADWRPIFLTTMAAAAGLTPMMLSGSALWSPLASVIAFGLIFSMIFTLLVVPVLYVLVTKDKPVAQLREVAERAALQHA